MSFFDMLIDKLFPGRDLHKPVEVMELLVRSHAYQQRYLEWKGSPEATKLVKAVERSFYAKKKQDKEGYEIHLFQSPAANGFALTYHPGISQLEFQFLLDFWRDRMLALNYRVANTDRQISEKETYVKTTEKHFLKPPFLRSGEKTEQAYGNVLLEYVLVNQQASYLKLMVTTYSDRQFTTAAPYMELVEHLFTA